MFDPALLSPARSITPDYHSVYTAQIPFWCVTGESQLASQEGILCVYGGNLRKQANYRTDPTALREATVVQSNVTQGEGLLAKAKDHAQVTQLDAATCYEGGGCARARLGSRLRKQVSGCRGPGRTERFLPWHWVLPCPCSESCQCRLQLCRKAASCVRYL